MDDEEKISKLDEEIIKLEEKEESRNKVNELLERRNRLKFPLLYKAGKTIKTGWSKFSVWADEKSKQMEEDLKKEQEEAKKEKKDDTKESESKEDEIYNKMFGETEANEDLSKQLGV